MLLKHEPRHQVSFFTISGKLYYDRNEDMDN